MFSINQPSFRLCDAISRREAMRIGGLSALGLSLPQLFRQQKLQAEESQAQPVRQSHGSFGKAKSVILFWLTGGPPQHETWDPKPDASAEVRGEFNALQTRIPGLHVGELMPRTADLIEQIAVLRAVVSQDNSHSSSGYQMLTGVPHVPLSQENATAKAPNFWPSLGAIVRALRPDRQGMPTAITLPRNIANVGEIVWPGQDAGFLGRKYDPWFLNCDPSQENFQVSGLEFPNQESVQRLVHRRTLLKQLEGAAFLHREPEFSDLDQYTQQAVDLLRGGGAGKAFDISQENEATRDRYGRYKFGQSVLLSRRLVEAGVPLVQVNWQQLEGKENHGSWDTHIAHSASLKDFLMPLMDQTFSALLEDLQERGLLDETLVAWVGEFGHTPKFNPRAGRDHWGNCFSVALAGAGIRGGVVHGMSDKDAAFPVEGRVAPCDIAATIFHCLGFDPETRMIDQSGRPLAITQGTPIEPILA
jgi:hypothetical protein